MSLAVIKSRALNGMEAPSVTVEVHLANGVPGFAIVGLPEVEVKESKDRVRAALLNANFSIPSQRITVNLAPADLPKDSARFDLPIAIGILVASGQIPSDGIEAYEFAGELSLSGELRPIHGALAMTYAISRSVQLRRNQMIAFILPKANAEEAALVSAMRIYPAENLLQVCAHFTSRDPAQRLGLYRTDSVAPSPNYPDFSDVKGQLQAKRALEVAAAGGHSVLMIGPPGTGKSMLATRFPGILPEMTEQEALESAAVQSLSSSFRTEFWRRRPFRSPHHTASAVALVGGGSSPKPGEISLAHRGTLFLDELPEFDRRVLEVLREPLESGRIHISRAARQAEFPAQFQLIAAMNPCPCGYHGNSNGQCRCTPQQIVRYQEKISGPLLDRIDVQILVPAISHEELRSSSNGEASCEIARRVGRARSRQIERQGRENAALNTKEIENFCKPKDDAARLLQRALEKFNWSARAYHRILKLARSIADLDQVGDVDVKHVSEALQYRKILKE